MSIKPFNRPIARMAPVAKKPECHEFGNKAIGSKAGIILAPRPEKFMCI